MSNETDLDWLALNVHEWPDSSCSYIYTMKIKGVTYPSWSRYSGEGKFTKDQWLARRAELQGKPSWDHAPEWAVYMAQYPNGHWEFFAVKPRVEGWWRHPIGERSSANNASIRGAILGEWCDTLEKRPEEFKPSIEEANRLAQELKPFTSIEGNQEQEMNQDNKWFDRGELPPVGVWCEASGDGASPEKCKIIAYHKGQVALQWEVFNGGCLDILELNGEYWKFSPIRTEREALIEIIAGNLSGTTGIVADAIIAAGFKLEAK